MDLSMENVDQLGLNDLLGVSLKCSCGKEHCMDVDSVVVAKGALKRVVEVVKQRGYKKPLVISDANTFAAAGEQVLKILEEAGVSYTAYCYKTKASLVPDEAALGTLLAQIEDSTDLLLAVGSGVINDVTKFVARKTKLPEILVATAPSMDGFVSDTSALTLNNLKSSVRCDLPKVIIGDIDILKKAPKRMILAGLGDMIGKYSALTDWNLSKFINGEYFCEPSAHLSVKAIEKCVDSVNRLPADGNFDDEGIEDIMDGLIRTGIAMSYVGNSRPASGSEHHMSHYWETMFLFQGKEALLHGTKVGLTSIIIAKIYEWLSKEKDFDFAHAEKEIRAFDQVAWEDKMRCFYQQAAPGIIANAAKDKRNDVDLRLKRLSFIKENIAKIQEIAASAQPYTVVENIMKKAGAPLRPIEVGISDEIVHNSVLVAHEVRQRYTILNLLHDLGMLEKYAEKVDAFLHEEK